ncbi:hypothetical protein [Janibacter sp. GXQ6167]|uniref:hypothetical protein n=1 Tax=Janibacter sp. GXQ6167 TaxID=3240791 RepID=UPI003526BDBB
MITTITDPVNGMSAAHLGSGAASSLRIETANFDPRPKAPAADLRSPRTGFLALHS